MVDIKKYRWAQIVYSNGIWHIDVEDYRGNQKGSDGRTFEEALRKLERDNG